jgi:hypothetical protein
VHHALMNVLEPILEQRFHPDSYACRRGKGTHAAADRLQHWMRGHRYTLPCDIRKFFPSIDHGILKQMFRRLIKDERLLWLMDLIVDNSNEQEIVPAWFPGDDLLSPAERRHGLPIGNLTSQWFANWFLTDLDHFITCKLRVGAYVRYCDDFILLHNDRAVLQDAIGAVRERLAELRLRLHEDRLGIHPVKAALSFVGYRMGPITRRLRAANVRQFRRRVRWMRHAYAEQRIDWPQIKPRLDSWMGHARQADSGRLIQRLSREWIFVRGGTDNGSCPAGRVVEQQSRQLPLCQPQQEQSRQPQQQHRVSCLPALPTSPADVARSQPVHGQVGSGHGSPGSAPVSRLVDGTEPTPHGTRGLVGNAESPRVSKSFWSQQESFVTKHD